MSIEVYIVKSKLLFLKTGFGIFQLQAPGNPGQLGERSWMSKFCMGNICLGKVKEIDGMK